MQSNYAWQQQQQDKRSKDTFQVERTTIQLPRPSAHIKEPLVQPIPTQEVVLGPALSKHYSSH